MLTSEFDFDLPEALIALRPAQPRDSARLLVVPPGGGFEDRSVADLPGLLRAGDALVFNDTRVIHARLTGERRRENSRAAIEIILLKSLGEGRWRTFGRPAKRLRMGDRVSFGDLEASVERRHEAEVDLAFDVAGEALDEAIARAGVMPLPPYIAGRRPGDARDEADYQTVYAREGASVAAPTAGLHFTPELLGRLKAAGVSLHFVTLHVGAGTFLPVKAERLEDHRMHAEWGEVGDEVARALNATRDRGGRVVCVGTTSLRLIESAATDDGRIHPFAGETDIFIAPGYCFKATDGLMTNFHLPKSTLFMLVSALAGAERMRKAYAHAIVGGYRFYSYGDASLLWQAP